MMASWCHRNVRTYLLTFYMFMFLKIVINKNFEYNSYFKNKLKRAYLDRCWISVFTFSTAYLGYEENQMFNVADLLSSVELFFCIFW